MFSYPFAIMLTLLICLSLYLNVSCYPLTYVDFNVLKKNHMVKDEKILNITETRTLEMINYVNITNAKTLPLLKNFKNPCWIEECSFGYECPGWMFRCFPFFMVMSAPHSGVEDLFEELQVHKQITPPNSFAPHYWDIKMYTSNMKEYIRNFDDASEKIVRQCLYKDNTNCVNDIVTGDATPDTFYKNELWRALPKNHLEKEPHLLTPKLLSIFQPRMRFIIIFREPVERLYVEYMKTYPDTATPIKFHNLVSHTIAELFDCVQVEPMRTCAYYPDLAYDGEKINLRAGIYEIFLIDWFKIYSRETFFIARYQDYMMDTYNVVERIIDFLDLEEPDPKFKATIERLWVKRMRWMEENKGPDYPDMLTETRRVLQGFYKHYNARLVDILGDDAYNWGYKI